MQKKLLKRLAFCSLLAANSFLFGQGMPQGSSKTTVFVQPVQNRSLYRTITYGGRIEPLNLFPQTAVVAGVIRSINVRVGQRVSAGQILYSVQQIVPGQNFLPSQTRSLNSGVVAQVAFDIGEQIALNDAVIYIADDSQTKINFYLSDKDAGKVNVGNPVYLVAALEKLKETQTAINQDYGARAAAIKRQEPQSLPSPTGLPYEDMGQEPIETAESDGTNQTIIEPDQALADLEAERQAKLAAAQTEAGKKEGVISLLPLIPDFETGLFSAQAVFKKTAELPLGKFERIALHTDHYDGLAVEQSYITRRYGKDHVTVIREGKTAYQEVLLGNIYGDMAAILAGLAEGDEIVVGSSGRYQIGDEVNTSRLSARRGQAPGRP